jgi:hypothetical protein
MKKYRLSDYCWQFYLNANLSNSAKKTNGNIFSGLISVLDILHETGILIIHRITQHLARENRTYFPQYQNPKSAIEELVMKDLQIQEVKGNTIVGNENVSNFYTLGLKFEGCTRVHDNQGKQNVIFDLFMLSYEINDDSFKIYANSDILLPIDADDNWQVEASKLNGDQFEFALSKIREELGYTAEFSDDEVLNRETALQKGFRLYNNPNQIEFALEYSKTLPPPDFDVEYYRILCQELYNKSTR